MLSFTEELQANRLTFEWKIEELSDRINTECQNKILLKLFFWFKVDWFNFFQILIVSILQILDSNTVTSFKGETVQLKSNYLFKFVSERLSLGKLDL